MIKKPLICALTNGDGSADSDRSRVRQALESRATFLQIREKSVSTRELLDLTVEAVNLTRDSLTRVLVNERFDVAIAAGAAGVHLTSTAIPVNLVRRLCPPEFVIGVSTHSFAEIETARIGGADFVTYGPVFAVPGKSSPVGLDGLRHAQTIAGHLPVVGLGGLTAPTWRECLSVCSGLASISLFDDDVARAEIRELVKL